MARHPLSAKRKATFVAELARHGIAMRAARSASPHSNSGALSTFQDERQRDPEFAAAWDDAVESARADVEHEIYRRSTEGYEEPVYGGKYRETVVGTVRKYSDRLLELRARALLPAYRDAAALNVNKRVTHDVDAGLLGNAVASVATRLAQSFRPEPLRVIEGRVSDDA
ncbi:hypothetical protein [Brevundimonas naejangsanensis]|uniref:hypothetical protein n=1 Tax=Brevundimonas naejangsanensis TaxID=588932 RepID=UPI0026EDAF7A|nr:hypothetical protein [Brevundimonas naejangsanensis]